MMIKEMFFSLFYGNDPRTIDPYIKGSMPRTIQIMLTDVIQLEKTKEKQFFTCSGPLDFPKGLSIRMDSMDDTTRFHLSWGAVVPDKDIWRDDPKVGTYSAFYKNIQLEEADKELFQVLGQNIKATQKSFNTENLDSESCLRRVSVAAVSRGGTGAHSSPVCAVLYSGGKKS